MFPIGNIWKQNLAWILQNQYSSPFIYLLHKNAKMRLALNNIQLTYDVHLDVIGNGKM